MALKLAEVGTRQVGHQGDLCGGQSSVRVV